MNKHSLIPTETINPRTRKLGSSSPQQIARMINTEDFNAARAVKKASAAIAKTIKVAAETFLNGGKIIFIGAGTSGRLGVLEAAECVPTFGTKPSQIVGIIAGGKKAMFRSQEGAEDDEKQGGKDVLKIATNKDLVIGITASGITPYVLGALKSAKQKACRTVLLACNKKADISHADIFIGLDTGAEALNGSTRMKAGTATKMALNAISTGAMARAGKVYENLMVDVQPTNQKLIRRAVRLIGTIAKTDEKTSHNLFLQSGKSVKTAIVMHCKKASRPQAQKQLQKHRGFLAEALHEN
ncbi:MAG: N-acetylmuramic acid 6-phosphate etherase [Elusimicrobiaceae bacterium]|nr:N-acetylmuramic acid 6-phosphate etherase [Elusimicrobiaceae bacterium]